MAEPAASKAAATHAHLEEASNVERHETEMAEKHAGDAILKAAEGNVTGAAAAERLSGEHNKVAELAAKGETPGTSESSTKVEEKAAKVEPAKAEEKAAAVASEKPVETETAAVQKVEVSLDDVDDTKEGDK
jgi:hypothetical protein